MESSLSFIIYLVYETAETAVGKTRDEVFHPENGFIKKIDIRGLFELFKQLLSRLRKLQLDI